MTSKIPIAYCDTSFIFEYWEAEVINEISDFDEVRKFNRPEYFDFIVSILKSENRIKAVEPLKNKLFNDFNGDVKIELVSSFFALSEIFEKHAEWNFKNIISESTGIDRSLNKGKKDIGDLINKVYKDESEVSESIFYALFPPDLDDALFGIKFLDIEKISFQLKDFYGNYSFLSVLQVGTVDILHLIAANHFNAEYFLTFDTDFKRVKKFAGQELNLKIVVGSDEISKFIKSLK